jgi:hypothetical protein
MTVLRELNNQIAEVSNQCKKASNKTKTAQFLRIEQVSAIDPSDLHCTEHLLVTEAAVFITNNREFAWIFHDSFITANMAGFDHHVDVCSSNMEAVNNLLCCDLIKDCGTFWYTNRFNCCTIFLFS